MKKHPPYKIIAKSEFFDEDNGEVFCAVELCKIYSDEHVIYMVSGNKQYFFFKDLISAIKKFNEMNYTSLI